MAKNWIIAAGRFGGNEISQPINLDTVSKIVWGGYLDTPAPHRVIFVHNYPATTDTTDNLTSFAYSSDAEAFAAYNLLIQQLSKEQITIDLTPPPDKYAPVLKYVNPAPTNADPSVNESKSVVQGTAGPYEITGNGLRDGGLVTITTNASTTPDECYKMPVTFSAGRYFIQLDTKIPAGTYDLVYTDSHGGYSVMPGFVVV